MDEPSVEIAPVLSVDAIVEILRAGRLAENSRESYGGSIVRYLCWAVEKRPQILHDWFLQEMLANQAPKARAKRIKAIMQPPAMICSQFLVLKFNTAAGSIKFRRPDFIQQIRHHFRIISHNET